MTHAIWGVISGTMGLFMGAALLKWQAAHRRLAVLPGRSARR
jgi:hypothetical protein